jgi:reverse gyrase
MERLLSEKDSKNTKRAISTSVKCFRNYLRANGIDQEFESFETGVLDSRLKEYYASVRCIRGYLQGSENGRGVTIVFAVCLSHTCIIFLQPTVKNTSFERFKFLINAISLQIVPETFTRS